MTTTVEPRTGEGTAHMDILVTESNGGTASEAVADLEAAGHRVHRCHAPSAPAFPCLGLVSGCPLEDGTIDLVVAARDHVRPTATPTEDGVTCGLRRGIPVAVVGQPLMNPFEPFGAVAVTGDLVSACERIARSRRGAYEEVAIATVRQSLAYEDIPSDRVAVSVERIDGRLRVEVKVPVEVPEPVRQHLAVRVVGRLREYDRHVAGIDIGVADLGDAT